MAIAIGPNFGFGPLGDHWAITPQDAKKLQNAYANFMRHFSPQVTQKMADGITLLKVSGSIVAPRALQSVLNSRARPPAPARAPAPPAPAPATAAPRQPAANGAAPNPTWTPQTPGELDPGAMAHSHATA